MVEKSSSEILTLSPQISAQNSTNSDCYPVMMNSPIFNSGVEPAKSNLELTQEKAAKEASLTERFWMN